MRPSEAQCAALTLWRGEILEARTFQPPAEAEAWLDEMLAHAESGKRRKTLSEMRDLMSDVELELAA